MRAVGVAEQRERPRLGDDRLPPARDLVERLVPRDRRECTSSVSRLTLAQAKPAVKGCSGSPWMRTTRPLSTVANSEHISGQSWAQTIRFVVLVIITAAAESRSPHM
jgi:hypothetical protein